MTGEEAVKAGRDLGFDIVNLIRKRGIDEDTAPLFYCASLAVQTTTIAAQLGKEALFVILEHIIKEIKDLPPV